MGLSRGFVLLVVSVSGLHPQSLSTLREAGAYDGLKIGTAVDSPYLTDPPTPLFWPRSIARFRRRTR